MRTGSARDSHLARRAENGWKQGADSPVGRNAHQGIQPAVHAEIPSSGDNEGGGRGVEEADGVSVECGGKGVDEARAPKFGGTAQRCLQ